MTEINEPNPTGAPDAEAPVDDVAADLTLAQKLLAGVAIVALVPTGTYLTLTELVNDPESRGVDNKVNPCSMDYDYDQQACTAVMESPTVAVVYPQGAGVNPRPILKFTDKAITAITGGESNASITAIPIAGKVGALMTESVCMPDPLTTHNVPLTVRAAQQEPAINQFDFVISLIPRKACSGGKSGVAYAGYGDRFSEVYMSPDEEYFDGMAANTENDRVVLHELGHSMFGLGHVNGLRTSGSEMARRYIDGKEYLDLDRSVIDKQLQEYGGSSSVMGDAYVTNRRHLEAKQLLTPMELGQISPANGIQHLTLRGTGSLSIPLKGEKTFISIEHHRSYAMFRDDEATELSVSELVFFIDETYGRQTFVQLYAKAGTGKLTYLANFNTDESVPLLITEKNGDRRELSVKRSGNMCAFYLRPAAP